MAVGPHTIVQIQHVGATARELYALDSDGRCWHGIVTQFGPPMLINWDGPANTPPFPPEP